MSLFIIQCSLVICSRRTLSCQKKEYFRNLYLSWQLQCLFSALYESLIAKSAASSRAISLKYQRGNRYYVLRGNPYIEIMKCFIDISFILKL